MKITKINKPTEIFCEDCGKKLWLVEIQKTTFFFHLDYLIFKCKNCGAIFGKRI